MHPQRPHKWILEEAPFGDLNEKSLLGSPMGNTTSPVHCLGEVLESSEEGALLEEVHPWGRASEF